MKKLGAKKRVFFTRNRINGYAFILPNIIGFLVFILIPVLASFIFSFTDWDGFGKMKYIGFDNYIKMFRNETFIISLRNTLYYIIVSVPVTLVLALAAAIALNKGITGQKVFRTAFFLPYITASVAVAVVWSLLYHPTMGPINRFLINLGVENPPRWLSSSQWAMTSVIIMSIWKRAGYYMVIYLAGLQQIPETLYDAANVDGANNWQKFRNVTFPMLTPAIFFSTIMAIIESFKVFDLVYTLTQGGPGRATNVLVYTIYQESFIRFKFGYASAIAYVLFAMILILTLIQFKGQKKYVNYL